MSHVSIRCEVLPEDVERVRTILAKTNFFNEAEVELGTSLAIERLRKGLESGYYFKLLELNGEVVAYCCYGPAVGTESSYDLYWLAVDPAQQHRGFGEQLLLEAEKAIYDLGGEKIYLETSSIALYQPTLAFYLHRGYEVAATLNDFYAPADDKMILVKRLKH